MNYQVLKGMSLELREDSLLYGPETRQVWTVGRSLIIRFGMRQYSEYMSISLPITYCDLLPLCNSNTETFCKLKVGFRFM